MANAIVKEAGIMQSYLKEPIETIYFGGGTPSLLNENQLEKIVQSLHHHYKINDNIEFTLEANPDDLSDEKLSAMVDLGVNRLSIGVQSFDNTTLSFLNRSHTSQQAKKAVEMSKKIGVDNISLDLIYGIPGQTKGQWEKNLEELIMLEPTHISCYALTIEDRTVFGNWVKKGKLKIAEDDITLKEYDFMIDFLAKKAYDHYEVSNFSKPGKISLHNSSYWQQKAYLGLGPGAHSYNGKERHFNVNNNPKYIRFIENDESVNSKETLNSNELLTEYILTHVRTKWGVDFKETERIFNFRLSNKQLHYIDKLVANKLATFVDEKLILNSSGFFTSDSIALELIPTP